ncbi:GNAT family N-acetyltransferase [Halobacillus sp. BBL2006]|uniref:GNAT family N-acetyltransferase n=1 Tax=Halobacillus sp. BBL2006 TaxID=1543706 RepID=UPI0005440E1A|nr:GNAT family N-acetyltransferase [Halobacillus sp. BBL2006]KHE73212.1 GCN5 family acetyltransferase [Halobacillus sp. BBL2006]
MISNLKPEEARAFVSLTSKLERESDFLLYEAGEREMSEDKARSMIQSIEKQKNSAIFVARSGDELIGHVMCIGGSARRNRHTVHIVTGVLADYRGKGWATRLFAEVDEWAVEHHIHRLELTVMVHNEPAKKLYEKAGFAIEGTKKDSLFVNGDWVDEYLMAKVF